MTKPRRHVLWKLGVILAAAVVLQLGGYYFDSETEQEEMQARLAALHRGDSRSAQEATQPTAPAAPQPPAPAREPHGEAAPARPPGEASPRAADEPRASLEPPWHAALEPVSPPVAPVADEARARMANESLSTTALRAAPAPAAPVRGAAPRPAGPFAAAVIDAAAALPRDGPGAPAELPPAGRCANAIAALGLCAPDLPPKGDSP